jgi:hypothetical protein
MSSLGGNVTTPFRKTITVFSLLGLVLMTACGTPKRALETTDTEFDSGTSPFQPADTTTSPTGTTTENLFSTQTGSQLQTPTQGSEQLGNVTSSEVHCLSTDAAWSLNQFGSQSSQSNQVGQPSAQSTSCLNSGSFGVDPSQLYQGAITSYQASEYCLGQAATKFAPQMGMSQLDVELRMQLAELTLITCMRDIVQYQSRLIPWGNTQVSAFHHADHNLWSIGMGIRRQQ